jgi:hypothetical protein
MLNLDSMTPNQARRLSELSENYYPNFLEMLEVINHANRESLAWLLSSLASRDNYRSPLFKRCCKLLLVEKSLEEGERQIATKDRSLAKVVKRLCLSRKISAEVRCQQNWSRVVCDRIRPWALLSSYMLRLARRCCGRRTVELPKESVVLLDVFVASDTETGAAINNGDYQDRYFCGWRDELTDDECHQVYYLPVLCGFEDEAEGFNKLRECDCAFLIPDDYLMWHDYLWVMSQVLRMASLKLPDCHVAGVPIGPLLRDERRTRFSEWSGIIGLLGHRFARRSAEMGLKVKRLVDWSENQAVDRGLVQGFYRYHPQTEVVAYKGYPLAENYHPHLCPSSAELKAKVHPRDIWVIGRAYANAIRSKTPEAKVSIGPALRYASINDAKAYDCNERNDLLIGLPIGEKECQAILALVYKVTTSISRELPIKIKPHPFTPRDVLLENGAADHADWIWVKGDFRERLAGARLFCTNASSTALESLAAGVPVLLLGNSQSITWNPIPKDIPGEAWALCYSAKELVAAIENLLLLPSDFMKDVSRQIRSECFTEPDGNNVRALLGLHEI